MSSVDINEIVSSYIDENELSNNKRFRLWQLAFKGMEQLGLDYFYKVQTFKVDINANHTALVPSESVTVLKVGVSDCNGELVASHEDDSLNSYKDMIGYDPSGNVYSNYYDGSSCGSLCFRRRDCGGSIKLDKDAGVITLSNFSSLGDLYVECVVAPDMNGQYKIPVQFKQPLISFIDWKSLPKNAKGTGVWRTMKNDFYNERRLAVARYRPFTLDNTLKHSHGYTR